MPVHQIASVGLIDDVGGLENDNLETQPLLKSSQSPHNHNTDMSPPNGGSPASGTQWHAVTPQTRPLSIAILELAPTSVTLALTRSPPTAVPASTPPVGNGPSSSKKKKKKRHGSNHQDSDDEVDDEEHAHGAIPGAYPYPSILAEGQTFKDMLSHGVVVTIDGMPWSRIVAHVSDDADEDDTAAGGSDDEGEWEDDWEHAGIEASGNEEGQSNSSCTQQGQAPRRRRRHRPSDASRNHTPRKAKADKVDKGPRWDRERAVVVVYDLDPSKEHEIELQIVGLSGEVKENLGGLPILMTTDPAVPVSNAVLIPPASPSSATLHPRSRANSLRSRSRPRSRSNSVNTPTPPVPSPLGHEIPSSPGSATPIPDSPVVPTSILSPIDAQTAQTRHLIAAAHAEREHLQLQIKEARKTAQRSEAALRTEIETLKRNNEKAGSNDQRNKQKYLALQEQVKQGWAGAESANKETEDVKAGLPEFETKLAAVTKDLEGVQAQWKKVNKKEEEARDASKASRAEEDRKMAEINSKVDKVRGRKEKKESERAELESKLEELEKQREEVERKAEEAKTAKRTGYYPGLRWDQPATAEFPAFEGRTLSAQPSVSNLGAANTFGPGPGFRPRPSFPHRYPSGGSRPIPPAQQSPTINQTFFPPNAPSSPAWNAKGSNQGRVGPGTNPTAPPFMPSTVNSTPPPAGTGFPDNGLHTAFMPPQLQHRIYLPNSVRPRPTPNFHPPPSVLAEQQAQSSTSSSQSSVKSMSPAFPPLPTASPPAVRPTTAGGPSLASVVSRAVLAPTSNALTTQPLAPGSGRAAGYTRAQLGGKDRGNEFPTLSPPRPSPSPAWSGSTESSS